MSWLDRVSPRPATVVIGLGCLGIACGSSGSTAQLADPSPTEAASLTVEPTIAPTAIAEPTSEPTAVPTATAVASAETSAPELYPDVLAAELVADGDRVFRVSVTLSSPYDSPERYADAWRVLDLDGNELGVRELAHDHAGEQPFTRSLSGVEIPSGVTEVVVEGRDQVSGWGGATLTVAVPD